MADIMKNNGYIPTINLMESLGREDMINMHKSMMER